MILESKGHIFMIRQNTRRESCQNSRKYCIRDSYVKCQDLGFFLMLEKMKEIIAEQLGVEEDEITPDTSFKEDLGADSLDLFELTMALEEEYDTEIPAEELEDIETVGDVIEYLREKGIDEQAVDNKRTDPDK